MACFALVLILNGKFCVELNAESPQKVIFDLHKY